jgi:hypothetical protein
MISKYLNPLRFLAIAGNALFVLWVLFNAMDSEWKGTIYQILSSIALVALLLINIVFLVMQSKKAKA